jgi:hypothetical protein
MSDVRGVGTEPRYGSVVVVFTARPAESRSVSLGATSTGAERTELREHALLNQTAGATRLTERISAGACSEHPVNGYGLKRSHLSGRKPLRQVSRVGVATSTGAQEQRRGRSGSRSVPTVRDP